ncbi:MAG: hypothetical protein OSA51_12485, partial [Octadecabacter sp.]|nr:hypothetical protein [Octadecabacter sp.]
LKRALGAALKRDRSMTPTIIQRNIGAPVGGAWRSSCWFFGDVKFILLVNPSPQNNEGRSVGSGQVVFRHIKYVV